MTTQRSRRLFLGAAALLGALAVLPATGWIVRQQLQIAGGRAPASWREVDESWNRPVDPRQVAAAGARPADFDRQLALAVQTAGEYDPHSPDGIGSPRVHALLRLRGRFDDQPALQAHILRYLSTGDLRAARDRDELILYPAKDQTDMAKASADAQATRPSTAALDLAEETARRGEALDPDNAYFPAMRAVALFGQMRDEDGLAALGEAAAKTTWNDYAVDEVKARWDLLEDATGRVSAIPRVAVAGGLLLPHLSRLRDAARVGTVLAIRREQNGDIAGGFETRRSVARLGALMRARSIYGIGSLVGSAITQLSAVRAGGSAALAHPSDDLAKAERDARYIAYLTRIDHPDEARWYVAERNAEETAREITSEAEAGTNNGLGDIEADAAWWAASGILLLTTLWTLALGCAASLLCRTPSISAGRRLSLAPTLPAVAVVTLAGIWIGVVIASFDGLQLGDTCSVLTVVATTVAAAALALLPLRRLRRGRGARQVAVEVGRAAAAISLGAASAASIGWLVAASCAGLEQAFYLVGNCICPSDGPIEADWPLRFVTAAIILAVPVVTLIALAIRSRIRRIPVSVGVARGLRDAALPIAAVLLLLYGGVAIGTAVEEANVGAVVVARVQNDCKYNAEVVHQSWPDLVSFAGQASR